MYKHPKHETKTLLYVFYCFSQMYLMFDAWCDLKYIYKKQEYPNMYSVNTVADNPINAI